jgi:hypothetical protein
MRVTEQSPLRRTQQPGKPKPPGNPRQEPDRGGPPPIEDPPEAIPTPPAEIDDPPPMEARPLRS